MWYFQYVNQQNVLGYGSLKFKWFNFADKS